MNALVFYVGNDLDIILHAQKYGPAAAIVDGLNATLVFSNGSSFEVSPADCLFLKGEITNGHALATIGPEYHEPRDLPSTQLVHFCQGRSLQWLIRHCKDNGFTRLEVRRGFRWWQEITKRQNTAMTLTINDVFESWQLAKEKAK